MTQQEELRNQLREVARLSDQLEEQGRLNTNTEEMLNREGERLLRELRELNS